MGRGFVWEPQNFFFCYSLHLLHPVHNLVALNVLHQGLHAGPLLHNRRGIGLHPHLDLGHIQPLSIPPPPHNEPLEPDDLDAPDQELSSDGITPHGNDSAWWHSCREGGSVQLDFGYQQAQIGSCVYVSASAGCGTTSVPSHKAGIHTESRACERQRHLSLHTPSSSLN